MTLAGIILSLSIMPRPLLTLTTDFGASSPYVAQMKGVIFALCRDLDLVDITHAIKPQNVREAAVVLADVAPRFPEGTIHVAVIDPGVGTARRIIYTELGSQRFVVPDNGLVSLLASSTTPRRIVAVENQRFWLPQPAATFHGRDILAPVAAQLALGADPAELGAARDELVKLDWPRPKISVRSVSGEVLYVDSFGNLITNIHAAEVQHLGSAASLRIDVGGRTIRGLVRTYGAALAGETVALVDSQGRIEIAIVEGDAARELHGSAGEPVVLQSK